MSDPIKLAEIQQALEEKRFEDAKQAAESYTFTYPDDIDGFLYGGRASLAVEDLDQANYFFTMVKTLDSSKIEALLALGRLGLMQESTNIASSNFNRVLRQDASNLVAIIGLGDCAYYDQDQIGAIKYYTKALESGAGSALNPTEVETFIFKAAHAHQQAGMLEEGIEFIGKYQPEGFSEGLTLVLRDLYRTKGDQEQEVFNKTEILYNNVPDNVKYAIEYAELLYVKQQYAEVDAIYTKILSLSNLEEASKIEILYARARVKTDLEDYTASIQDYTDLVALEEKWYYYQERAELYIKLKKAKEALADYNKAVELQDTPLYTTIQARGTLYMKAKAYDKAVADFTRLVKMENTNSDGYLALGEAFRAKKEIGKAFKMYLQAEIYGSLKAGEVLAKHFGKQVAQMRAKASAEFLPKFQSAFARNAKSPILQQVFGKLWVPDMNKFILAMGDEAKTLSASIVERILDEVAQDMFLMTEQGFLLFEGTQAPLEAYYKVEVESEHAILLEIQPARGGETVGMRIAFHDGSLMLTYPVQDTEVPARYFQAVTSLSDEQKTRLTTKQYDTDYIESIESTIKTLSA
ncbi:MAG: hypothetical protein MK212_00530 [Saprospiraceae bacterium]|nr:hypothetical protein [Saprospiraceae bacterium]